MSYYRRMRTTSGRKYCVRMAEDEIAERITAKALTYTLTFVAAAGMFLLWIKVG